MVLSEEGICQEGKQEGLNCLSLHKWEFSLPASNVNHLDRERSAYFLTILIPTRICSRFFLSRCVYYRKHMRHICEGMILLLNVFPGLETT